MSRTSTGRVRLILPTTRGTGVLPERAVDDLARMLVVDALERRGEVVGVALAPHLAVGDDVDAGPLHVADGEQGGVVLRLLQEGSGTRQISLQARARHDLAQHLAVHQPVGLRVGADDGGLQKGVWSSHCALMPAAFTSSPFSSSSRTTSSSKSSGEVGDGIGADLGQPLLDLGQGEHGDQLLVELARPRPAACRPAPAGPTQKL